MDHGDGVDLSALRSPPYHTASPQAHAPFPGDGQNTYYDPPPRTQPGHQSRDSQASLLDNAALPASISPQPYYGVGTSYDAGYRAPHMVPRPTTSPSWWRWRSSWNMYVCFLFGLACAIGHHIFYNALDGQVADSQIQMLRYGTVLAFAAKAGLGAAVVSAYRQRVWTTVKTRLMAVGAIDSLFAAAEDLTALLNWGFFRGAKTAAALACFAWLAPLMVILTANTLVVELRTVVVRGSCPGVRTLNFALEDTNDWRTPPRIDGLYEIPLSLWNTTKPPNKDPPGWFDYYTAPGLNFQQTATLSSFLDQVVERKNASVESCGIGWNCTFEIKFTAPGYQCKQLASGVGSKPTNLTQQSGSAAPPFGTDILLPKGRYAYYAFTSGGEYSTTQMADVGPGGIPNTKPPYPKNLGALRTEPVIWVGYAVLANPDQDQPNQPSDPKWATAFVPKIFACEHLETAYTARLNYSDGTQTALITNRTFLGPIINTTFVPGRTANDGTADNVTAVPESNYVFPQDVGRYRRVAAYHSLGFMLRGFINGTVEIENSLVNPIANTEAMTRLLDPRNNYFPYPNLMDLVQGFYEDIILSILSNPNFVEVVWAAQPSEQTGTLKRGGVDANSSLYEYPCTRTRTANMYSYHARDLWIVYGISVAVALLCVGVGIVAIRENGGVTRNTRFSSIVAATRGPALDKISWEGPGVDRAEVPVDVTRERLGYGLIGGQPAGGLAQGGGETSGYESPWKPSEIRYGFGLEGDIKQRTEGSLLKRSWR